MSYNKVMLLGNVGRDPEIRESQSGKFATFTLATTDRGYTKKDGTQVPERTEWHNIVVGSAGLAGVVEQYVKKGTKLFIEGKLHTRKYTAKDNTERYVTEVYVENFELLSAKQDAPAAQAPAPNPVPPFYNQQRYQNAPASVQQNWGGSDNTDAPF